MSSSMGDTSEDDSCFFVMFVRVGDCAAEAAAEIDPPFLPFFGLVRFFFFFFSESSLIDDPRKGDEAAALVGPDDENADVECDDNPRNTLAEVTPDGSVGREEGMSGCRFGDDKAIALSLREASSLGERERASEEGAFLASKTRSSFSPLAALSLR